MINYIGVLRKRVEDHIKVGTDANEEYEPAMIITAQHNRQSFIITLSAFWKYVEPSAYAGDGRARIADQEDFDKVKYAALHKRDIALQFSMPREYQESLLDAECCVYAELFADGFKIYKCTAYNLVRCLQMFSIDINPHSVYQLLSWIQDSLEDMKNMKMAEPETKLNAGDVEFNINGTKITVPLTVGESDFVQ